MEYLTKRNLKCRNYLNDGIERPRIFAWMPTISIYLNVPDGHSLEFIGMLGGKSKPENGIISYKKWKELEAK